MGVLIDDLLTFSRLSRAPVTEHAVNTAKLVQDVLEGLNPQREGRQIEFALTNYQHAGATRHYCGRFGSICYQTP